MLRIAICDDEIAMAAKIEDLLYAYQDKDDIKKFEIDVFYDGQTLVNSYENGDRYDLVFLDIEMKTVNGLDAARAIREKDQYFVLIYISGFESYMKDLFEVEPFRFISKPIDRSIFMEHLDKACEKISKKNTYFHFSYDKEIYIIPVRAIIYFRSNKRTIFIHTTEGVKKFYGKLDDMEATMEGQGHLFLRIHQSYLVNYQYIARLGYRSVELTNKAQLSISVQRQKSIRSKYFRDIGGEIID